MLPRADNVIRFPVELRERPLMRLLYQLQRDVRTLFMHAEGLGFELPPDDFRDRTDHATAGHIAAHLDDDGRAPQSFLDELLVPLLRQAVEAARNAVVAGRAAMTAQQRAQSVHAPDALKERALKATQHAVRLGLEAHILCKETAGVDRAVRYPRRGEPWMTRTEEVDMDILLAAEMARRSRKLVYRTPPSCAEGRRRLHRARRSSAEGSSRGTG